jgi:hypothetical protein
MVFAIAGLGKWVDEGGVLERRRLRALSRVGNPVSEVHRSPHSRHQWNDGDSRACVAVTHCVVLYEGSGAARSAGLVLVLVAVQVNLGFLGHEIPAMGGVHGLNALLLSSAAFYTAHRVPAVAARSTVEPEARVPTNA